MSYCVNCGVELEASAKACPLCNTPVINVNQLKNLETPPSFPKEKGEVETVNRKDMAILLTAFVLATAVTCGLLNALAFQGTMWSLAVIGVCVILWVWCFPLVITHRMPVYLLLLLDGGAVALYLYMLAYMIGSFEWCYHLGLPIVALVTVLAELLTLCIRIFPKSVLSISLYLVTGAGILCTGLELLIDRYVRDEFALGWSAVVLTVCAILDIIIITMLSRRRLRSEVRRRLHF